MEKNKLISDLAINLFESTSPTVVAIASETGKIGSGIVWDVDGFAVTCNHIIRRSDELEVIFSDRRTFPAKVVGRDARSNVALLEIEGTKLRPISVTELENVRTGQLVFALANHNARLQGICQGMIVCPKAPLVSEKAGRRMVANVIVTDTHLNFRYLGGPMIDTDGKLIGLNVAYRAGRGFVLGVKKLNSVVQQLKKYGKVNHGYLGITSREISLPRHLAKQDEGLIVFSVKKNTPAKKAGVFIGDIIIKFNNEPVYSLADLDELLDEQSIGKSFNVSILRGEKLLDINITPEQIAY
jgi:S1-C subfamily serine protease